MKRIWFASLPVLVFISPLKVFAMEQLIPAGSLVQCTVAEPKLSSKATEVGDPVLCQVNHVELYGRSVFPYGSYLVGRFEDYKDPGHFVGKGWMELRFERMVIPPDIILPVSAKVVYAPKEEVDKQGRIHGRGHPVRDTVEWLIPVLWPIDLINLPRRGPRPELKAETRLTLKLMDDLGVPVASQTAAANYGYPQYSAPQNPYGFSQRPQTYYAPQQAAPPTAYAPQQAPPPAGYVPQQAPPATYAAPAPNPYLPIAAPAPRPAWVRPRVMTVLMLRGGYGQFASDYWYEGPGRLRYVPINGAPVVIPAEALDYASTVEVNRRRGVAFDIRYFTN
ncbi:MAG: hypothetical protein ACJ746_31055 [Bryobacteraceae bacterium]